MWEFGAHEGVLASKGTSLSWIDTYQKDDTKQAIIVRSKCDRIAEERLDIFLPWPGNKDRGEPYAVALNIRQYYAD